MQIVTANLDKEYFSYKEKYKWNEEFPQEFILNCYGGITKWSGWYKGWVNECGHHRSNGPARIWEGGAREYHLNGRYFPNIKNDIDWMIKQIIE